MRRIAWTLGLGLVACGGGEAGDPAATLATTEAGDTGSGTSLDGDDDGDGDDGDGTGSGTGGTVPGGSTDGESGEPDDSTTGGAPVVPGGVFLWNGAGGGGPGTDLHPDEVEALLAGAGVEVSLGETLPPDFVDRFGTLVYLNPMGDFDASVDAAAIDLVERGGRLVLLMEHCKNGCWGNADGHNALLGALGSSMTLHGDGGAPLRDTLLAVTPAPPLTDGADELVAYYSGRVEVGQGIAVGSIVNGDVVIGLEALGWGEVVAIADSSMLGYRLDAADNAQLVLNFALH